jgi:hypothetical protein
VANLPAAIGATGPQRLVVAAVKHEVAVVLHVQSRVVVSATSVGSPARVFIVAAVSRIIQHEIAISLDYDVCVTMVIRTSGPECVQRMGTVNDKVSIILHSREELAIVAGEAFSFLESFIHSK